MSFNQNSLEDTSGVGNDSYFTTSPLQHMSRRHIMSLNARIAGIVGLASDSLFRATPTDLVVSNCEKNVSTTLLLYLEDWPHCSFEFPEDYATFCDYSNLPMRATV